MAEGIKELVNHATNLFARCESSSTGGEDEDVAALALYTHIVEMTDGIEVLISRSCAIPAIPLLRSSFEAVLALHYILETESEYVRRSLSWLCGYIHSRIAMYESFDPSTTRGRNFQIAVSADEAARRVSLPDTTDAQEAIDNLRQVLIKPHFKPIEAEYDKPKRRPHWFQLFGGPSDLHLLAKHLKREAQYEFLYRRWSTVSHANDFSRLMGVTKTGGHTIRQLRDPDAINEVMSFAPTFMLEATRAMMHKFRPGEAASLSKWYKTEVRLRFRLMTFESPIPDG